MSTTLSDILGYTSILCWLGAQFPQVVENARRKSVEGLALPFLLNWLLGDFTNLVGCILTHQLPFQTWLAVYFVFVDCSLLGQYAYYRNRTPTTPYLRARSASYAGRAPTDHHYRTISTVAANVAALAAQQDANTPRGHRSKWLDHSTDELYEEPNTSRRFSTDEEYDEDALARMADSFHSEGGQSNKHKHVSWSKERSRRSGSLGAAQRQAVASSLRTVRPSLHMTASQEASHPQRGRPLERSEGDEEEGSKPGRASTSRASRKGASMIFLSVWALYGVGTLVQNKRGMPVDSLLHPGRVLSTTNNIMDYEPLQVVRVEDVFSSLSPVTVIMDSTDPAEPVPPPGDEDPDWERIVGRIFAWSCTVLYLTSRLPQIWKNYVRKSVEGLSMYLFVFAFLGNVFYVSSLLSSPRLELPDSANYIRESIPYILGSGGTLMFDITIVGQSFVYRPKPDRRGRETSRRSLAAEEEGLLSSGATGADAEAIPPRRRMGGEIEGE